MKIVSRVVLVLVIASAIVIAAQAVAVGAAPYSLEQIDAPRGYLQHGRALAVSGDYAVITAGWIDGSAMFIFKRLGDAWVLQKTFESPSGGFGRSVDIDADRIIVGDNVADRAYVYKRTGEAWALEAELQSAAAGDQFGHSVAIDGDLVAVGAPIADETTVPNAGGIRIFSRASGTWTYLYDVFADPITGAWMGASVALEDGTLVSSASEITIDGKTNAGSVYSWTVGGETFTYHGVIRNGEVAEQALGSEVALSGTTLVMSAYSGGPYVYVGSGGSWTYQGALIPTSVTPSAMYAWNADVSGDTAIVGCDQQLYGGITRRVAFIFRRSGSTWSESQVLIASDDTATGTQMLAISPSTAIVASMAGSGKVYFYTTPRMLPVYRFYNFTNGTHFFTPSSEEREAVRAKWPNVFSDEGVAYYMNVERNTHPLYRFYNRASGSHFYTASAEEADIVLAKWSNVLTLEGQTYAVCPSPVPNSIPVYRFYNKKNGSHFYTASAEERDIVSARWSATYDFEGPAFWLAQ